MTQSVDKLVVVSDLYTTRETSDIAEYFVQP